MKIYASTSLDPQLSELCEGALINEEFTTHAMAADGGIISFTSGGITYVAVLKIENIDGEGNALLVAAVHPVGSEGLEAVIADLQSD
jgi:hypothetical protein